MSAISSVNEHPVIAIQTRRSITGDHPTVMTDIYQDDTNIVIWQRHLSDELALAADHTMQTYPTLQKSLTVAPQYAYSSVHDALGTTEATRVLSDDIAQIVSMFCCLFELKFAGLRLTVLDRAMCPRFHVDRVPCRLITTYCGSATQWLAHDTVDRAKLGAGNNGLADAQSGVYRKEVDIRQLNVGDVALLKGESWEGNEHGGLVHRSPQLRADEKRLIMTLDFQ